MLEKPHSSELFKLSLAFGLHSFVSAPRMHLFIFLYTIIKVVEKKLSSY